MLIPQIEKELQRRRWQDVTQTVMKGGLKNIIKSVGQGGQVWKSYDPWIQAAKRLRAARGQASLIAAGIGALLGMASAAPPGY